MFNRNHIFMIGALLLFLGIQFRMVETVVLNEHATHFIATRMGSESDATLVKMVNFGEPQAKKEITPPNWVGWLLLSAGVVMVLHSLAMPKPSA